MLPISPDFIESVQGTAFPFEDVLGGLGPDERLRLGVVLHEVVIDRAPRSSKLEWLPRRMRFVVISASETTLR